VIFSAWARLLRLASDALADQEIPAATLVGSLDERKAALARFCGSAPVAASGDGGGGAVAALLVPLFGGASGAGGGGAAGLTLTGASVAILLEPALQPGIGPGPTGAAMRTQRPSQ
jgi:hypothetical protein